MTNNTKITIITALAVIIAVHIVIALLTPQDWVLIPASVYAIAALAVLWSMRDDSN